MKGKRRKISLVRMNRLTGFEQEHQGNQVSDFSIIFRRKLDKMLGNEQEIVDENNKLYKNISLDM